MKTLADPHRMAEWTREDHAENARQIQRNADRILWDQVGDCVGVRGRDLVDLLARLLDERIRRFFEEELPILAKKDSEEKTAPALREAVLDLIADDVMDLIEMATSQGSENERQDSSPRAAVGGEEKGKGRPEKKPKSGEEATEALELF